MRLENIAKLGLKCLLLTIVLGFFTLSLKAGETVTIDNLTLGDLLLGNAVTKEDMKDHVVAIEFWGYNCGPCRASIPHMVELVNKYGPDGLILIGIHSQDVSKEQVIGLCKSLKVNYPIYASGNIKGISFSAIPHFSIFDYQGKLAFDGHPAEADKKLDELMKQMPPPLVGEGPYKKLKSLAEQIGQHKNLGQAMLQLRKKSDSTDADEKSEAEQLMGRLTKYAQRMTNNAETLKEQEPLQSYGLYQKLNDEFKGDEIGTNTAKTLTELKKDEVFQKALKADKDWLKINEMHDGLKPCRADKPLDIKNCAACQKKNNDLLSQINSSGKQLLKQYPETPAAQKVKDLFAELGIELK
jgi:cytochrome c biogenesis protein CcmG, thiol:disulfide interchange protein DsbE